MTETVLFVGGSADGKRVVIDRPSIYFDWPVMKGEATWTDCPERLPVTIERYRREILHSGTKEYPVYLSTTESPDNLIPLLIAGYRKDKI